MRYFCILLIFGLNLGTIITIPALGVKGAAIAAMIARVLGGFMIVYILFRKKSKIHLNKDDKFKLDKKVIKRIIKIGIPSVIWCYDRNLS